MARVIEVEERIYRPKKAKFKTVYKKDSVMKLAFDIFTKVFTVIGALILLTTNDYDTYKVGIFFLFTGLLVSTVVYVNLINSEPKFKSDALVPNEKGKHYMLNYGVEVIEHLGDAVKSLVPENLTGRVLLIHAEMVKRMGAVIGKPGSGKTVQLKGLFEGQLRLGGGAFILDAKGTLDEIKRFFGIIFKYGREKDTFHLNFSDMNNTHTINVLGNGGALMLKEILMTLSSASEDKWRQVDESFITAILKFLTYKRDNEGEVLYLKKLSTYLTLTRLLREAWKYRKKVAEDTRIEDFVRYLTTKIEIDYEEFVTAKDDDKKFYEKCEENSQNSDLQGVYEAGLGAGNWEAVLTTLGSDYGKIFNTQYPDVDLFEAVQNNKIILVSLPTMESEETSQKLGKLILGIIKSVADQKIKNSFEPEIPFLFLLDEFGSVVIKGFGRFMSKARSLGMSIILYFQSIAQLDVVDDGKGLEKKEILDMCNFYACLKNTDDELAEKLSKVIPKKVILDMTYKEKKEGIPLGQSSNLSKEYDYQIKEEDALKAEYMAKLNNGEMYFVSGAEMYKSVSTAPSDFNLSYKAKQIDAKIPLLKVYPKAKLVEDFSGEIKTKIFKSNLVYNIPFQKDKKAA